VLFELLTFAPPRKAKTVAGAVDEARLGRRVAFEETPGGHAVPRELRAITNKATCPGAEGRYPSVAAFAEDLRRYTRQEEVLAYPDGILRKAWRAIGRRPVAAMSALLVFIVGAALLATFSLARSVQTEHAAKQRQERLADLTAEVTEHAHEFDRLLYRVESLLEGLASSTRELLAYAAPQEGPRYPPAALGTPEGPDDATWNGRLNQYVAHRHVVYVLAPGVTAEEVARDHHRLLSLDAVFRSMFLRVTGEEALSLGDGEATALLRAGVPLRWSYAAFESGFMLNYPGNSVYPSDYDPRKRPWYVASRGTRGIRWGEVYPDAAGSGFLLPCNRALYAVDGTFVGVAGADLSLDSVIDSMEMRGLAGTQESFFVNAAGEVLVSSRERGARSQVSTQGNRTKQRRRVEVPPLERQLAAGAASGFAVQRQDLYVFARLKALPWFLVVRLDAATHDMR
jgi:hypothetical protein